MPVQSKAAHLRALRPALSSGWEPRQPSCHPLPGAPPGGPQPSRAGQRQLQGPPHGGPTGWAPAGDGVGRHVRVMNALPKMASWPATCCSLQGSRAWTWRGSSPRWGGVLGRSSLSYVRQVVGPVAGSRLTKRSQAVLQSAGIIEGQTPGAGQVRAMDSVDG